MQKKTEKPEPKNMAAIQIDYDRVLLMPVEEGLEFMQLISKADIKGGDAMAVAVLLQKIDKLVKAEPKKEEKPKEK